MLSNYYTLRYIVSTLDSTLKGRRVGEVFSQHRDELALAFENSEEHLVISCRRDASTMYLDGRMTRARRNTADVLTEVRGSTITGLTVSGIDRIACIALDSGLRVAVLFFGARSNACTLAPTGEILNAFKHGQQLCGTRLELPAGEMVFDFLAFRSAAAAPAETAASLVKKSFPALGATLVQEVFTRSAIAPSRHAASLDGPSLSALEGAIRSVLADCEAPAARLYFGEDGLPALFSIIPLRQAIHLTERRYDDVHRALREFITRRSVSAGAMREKNVLLSTLRQRIEKARRAQQAIDADVEAAGRAAAYERFAETLLANLHAFSKGARSIVLGAEGASLTIPLDPSLTPVQNAQRYFEKSKRARSAVREGASRRALLDRVISHGEELAEGAGCCTSTVELKAFMTEHAAGLEAFGIGRKSEARQELPFRIFVVAGGFEVWAGKSSANNDLLTLRYAKPDDLWFHARGASGSHVVLKVASGKGEPGKKAREQAAGIAAYYSRMKNAGMVPVAMTQKRYVRKPKGSPPGTVVIEREKVIFAEPALPATEPGSVV